MNRLVRRHPFTADDNVRRVVAIHRSLRVPKRKRHLGQPFLVYPSVFSPFVAPSGRVGLAFAAQPYFKSKSILDVGCGSGVIACLIALSGASRVLGIDINPEAIQNSKQNARKLRVEHLMEFRLADICSVNLGLERFDIIYADLPFINKVPNDVLDAAFYDFNLHAIRSLLSRLDALLAPKGKAFICLSNLDGDNIAQMINESLFSWRVHFVYKLSWIELRLIEIVRKEVPD